MAGHTSNSIIAFGLSNKNIPIWENGGWLGIRDHKGYCTECEGNLQSFAVCYCELRKKSDVLDDFRMCMLSRNFLPLIRQIQMSYIIKVIT